MGTGATKIKAWEYGESSAPRSILFGPDLLEPTSHIFRVDEHPVVVKAYGFGESDKITVHMVEIAPNGTVYSAPFRLAGCDLVLSEGDPMAIIPIPGLYRATLVAAPGSVYAVQYEAEMLRDLMRWSTGVSRAVPTVCPE